MGKLIEFYGTECKHCIEMEPLIARLKEETGVEIERVEVWHNEENKKRWQETDNGQCGGVPFFWNEETKEFICGSASYEKLKEWALKKA